MATITQTRPAGRQRSTLGNTLPAELQLLIEACSPAPQPSRLEKILRLPIDWEQVEILAQNHGVLPLMAHRLATSQLSLPSALRTEFRKIYEENVQHNLWFTRGLFLVLDSLEEAGVAAIAFKGPALALQAYGDLGLRQFWDLDVLVERQSWTRGKSALIHAGFTPKLELTEQQEVAFLASASEFTFHHGEVRNILEIQWGLLPRFYAIDIEVGDLLNRARFVELCERAVPVLGAEDLLISLLVHGAKHMWTKLCWIADIAHLIAAANLDWEVVRQRAANWRIERLVQTGLYLARRLLQADLPPNVSEWLKSDQHAREMGEDLATGLLRNRKIDVESVPYFWEFARQRERLRDRLRFVGRLAITPGVGEWETVQLSGSLFPLYRLVRLYRLARRFFR